MWVDQVPYAFCLECFLPHFKRSKAVAVSDEDMEDGPGPTIGDFARYRMHFQQQNRLTGWKGFVDMVCWYLYTHYLVGKIHYLLTVDDLISAPPWMYFE